MLRSAKDVAKHAEDVAKHAEDVAKYAEDGQGRCQACLRYPHHTYSKNFKINNDLIYKHI